MERVRDDLGDPHEARLHVTDEEQVDRAEQEAADPDHEPHLADVLNEVFLRGGGVEHAEQRRIDPEQGG